MSVSMSAPFPMVLFAGFRGSRSKRRKGIIIIYRRCTHPFFCLMPAVGARARPRPITAGVSMRRPQPGRRCHSSVRVVETSSIGVKLWSSRSQRWERAQVLHLEVLRLLWRRPTPVHSKPVHQMSRVVGEDTSISRQTISHNPISFDVSYPILSSKQAWYKLTCRGDCLDHD